MDLELDLSDDEEAAAERQLTGAGGGAAGRTLAGGRYEAIPMYADGVVYDEDEEERGQGQARGGAVRKPLEVGGTRGREGLSEADGDAWDRLG